MASSTVTVAKMLPTGGKKGVAGARSLRKERAVDVKSAGEALSGVSETLLKKYPISSFQARVYALTQEIPTGYVTTYGAMAQMLHSSPRAIGQALKRNPFAPIVPCHRVIAQGGLGGFFGAVEGENMDRKVSLLKAEGVHLVDSDTPESNKSKPNARHVEEKTSSTEEDGQKRGTKTSATTKSPLNFSSAVIDASSILDGESLKEAITKAREAKKKGFHFATDNSSTVVTPSKNETHTMTPS